MIGKVKNLKNKTLVKTERDSCHIAKSLFFKTNKQTNTLVYQMSLSHFIKL